MTMTRTLIATTAALGFAAASHADIVVQYDNEFPTNEQLDTGDDTFDNLGGFTLSDLDGDGSADDVTGSQPANSGDRFNEDSTFYNPSSVSGYTGPAIFGGVRGQSLDNSSVNFDDRNLADFLIRSQGSATSSERVHIAVFFPTQATILDADSFIGFSSDADGDPDGLIFNESLTSRFLLRTTGNNFFVSNTTISDSADGRVLDGTELATETFAAYSPNSDINFDQSTAAFTFTTADLNAMGITGYGVYSENDAFSTGRRRFSFSQFYADAELAPIPEPASLALLSLGGLLLIPVRGRAAAGGVTTAMPPLSTRDTPWRWERQRSHRLFSFRGRWRRGVPQTVSGAMMRAATPGGSIRCRETSVIRRNKV